MPHRRQLIREAVKAALVAGATVAGARVYETRMTPWERVELPAISVYALSETAQDNGSAPRELERSLQLEVVGAVEAGDDVDDTLDALAMEIERAMHADPTFGDVCNDSILASTEMVIDVTGRKPIGFVSLTFSVRYFTDAPDGADVALDDLKTVQTAYDLAGAQESGDQAQDTIDGLET